MFYISSSKLTFSDKLYGITDTKDNVGEFYNIKSIKSFITRGIKIEGVTVVNNKLTIKITSLKDIVAKIVAKYKLLYGADLKLSSDFRTLLEIENKSITSFKIPDFVVSLVGNCFCNCPKLKGVSIPNSVSSIGEGYFPSSTKIIRL